MLSRVAALCIVYRIHDSRRCPFGEAVVREDDGQARQTLPTEKAIETIEIPPKARKGPKFATFCGLNSDRAKLSEFI